MEAAEIFTAIQDVASWLTLNVRVLVRYGDLLSGAERQVYASRTTRVAFNDMENAGDNYLCHHGPELVKPVLAAHLTQPSAALTEAVERIAKMVSTQIHANVGLGPFVAVLLCLPPLFSFEESVTQVTREIMAGMYEAVAGALQRAGHVVLLRAVHQFAAFIVCARYWHRNVGGAAYDFYGAISPGFMLHDVRGAMPDLESLWTEEQRAADWAQVFSGAQWKWRPALQLVLAEMAETGSLQREVRTHPSGCAQWEQLEANTLFQRLSFRCAERDCPERFVTNYHEDHNHAVREAVAAGWFKPSTKTWNQGARCPFHRW